MPLYEYECGACGQRFEMIQKFSDAPPEACAKCGKGPVSRLLSSPAIQFKGTGWYITDYSQKGKSSEQSTGSDAKKTDASAGAASGDAAKKSEATPAATAPSKTTSGD